MDSENVDDYDAQTFLVMERILDRDSNCIDVGAHSGAILARMVGYAPEGIHHAFEPLPRFYERLKADFPSVRVHAIALSDTAGTISFQHVINDPAYSGIRRRKYDFEGATIEQITVEAGRLDDLYPPDTPVKFIKIDVEGAEYQVLKGAVETIIRQRPVIVFEHGLGAADHYDVTPGHMFDLLSGCRMQVSTMGRWLGYARPFNKKEFEAQFYEAINYYFIAYPKPGVLGYIRSWIDNVGRKLNVR